MKLRTLTVVLAAAAATVSLASPVAAADVVLQPNQLDRGDGPAITIVHQGTIVDGDLRVPLGTSAVFVGKSGSDYLVMTPEQKANGWKLKRVSADGTTRVLGHNGNPVAEVSADGKSVVVGSYSQKNGRMRVLSATTGARIARHSFPGGDTQILDFEDGKVLFSSNRQGGTYVWQIDQARHRRVTPREAYFGDLGLDRMAFFTRDPYDNGCSVLSNLAGTQRILRSCSERIEAISPDGSKIATVDLLADGLGPGTVWARTISGQLIQSYTAYTFGLIDFESDDSLMFEVYGRRSSTIARCEGADCERTTSVKRVAGL